MSDSPMLTAILGVLEEIVGQTPITRAHSYSLESNDARRHLAEKIEQALIPEGGFCLAVRTKEYAEYPDPVGIAPQILIHQATGPTLLGHRMSDDQLADLAAGIEIFGAVLDSDKNHEIDQIFHRIGDPILESIRDQNNPA